MRTKHGVSVRRTPNEVLIKQLETWDAIRDKFAKEDAFFAKVVESQRQYAANIVPGRMAMYPAYSFFRLLLEAEAGREAERQVEVIR